VFEDIDITDIVPIIALGAVQEAQSKVLRSTGLPGIAYLKELLNCRNDKRIYSVLRMKRDTFLGLCQWFKNSNSLKDTVYLAIT
jgi:hypothetical protein